MTSPRTNPWAPKTWGHSTSESPAPAPNMREIMDEEIARQLQNAENPPQIQNPLDFEISVSYEDEKMDEEEQQESLEPHSSFSKSLESSCSNDFLLAQLLQSQFDREYDKILALEEKKLNGNEKVQLSFQNFKKRIDSKEDSSSREDSEDEDSKEIRNFKLDNRKAPDFGPSGVIKTKDGQLVTKHDKVVCGRKNTDRVMAFPPEFQTGDAVKMDMQLNNKVFNRLKVHMQQEEKKMHRICDKKDKATSELALDANTRIVIYKMVNSGLLESVTGAIATGKEAIVLHARGGDSIEEQIAIPKECALKVFITMLIDFKNRSQYVKEDYRFKNRRKVLKIWAEKEMMNLNRMRRAGIRCPDVVKLKKHVLVMSFLGENGVAAPKLKDVIFEDEQQLRKAFDQCVEALTLMYNECKLVHGDFSEFNILYHKGDCYTIDVAQAMDLSHPKSLIFLSRDCRNILQFFRKSGLENSPSQRELFAQITKLDQFTDDEMFEIELEEYVQENAPNLDSKRGGGKNGAKNENLKISSGRNCFEEVDDEK